MPPIIAERTGLHIFARLTDVLAAGELCVEAALSSGPNLIRTDEKVPAHRPVKLGRPQGYEGRLRNAAKVVMSNDQVALFFRLQWFAQTRQRRWRWFRYPAHTKAKPRDLI